MFGNFGPQVWIYDLGQIAIRNANTKLTGGWRKVLLLVLIFIIFPDFFCPNHRSHWVDSAFTVAQHRGRVGNCSCWFLTNETDIDDLTDQVKAFHPVLSS